jgi:hypothetical protein
MPRLAIVDAAEFSSREEAFGLHAYVSGVSGRMDIGLPRRVEFVGPQSHLGVGKGGIVA